MGAFSSGAFATSAFGGGAFSLDEEVTVVEHYPQDRWTAPVGHAYSPSGAHLKRKRRGKRDEILFLRP